MPVILITLTWATCVHYMFLSIQSAVFISYICSCFSKIGCIGSCEL